MRTSRLRTSREVDARDIEERSFEFAVAIVRFATKHDGNLPKTVAENLVSAGTAVGAAVMESVSGGSRRHALAKMVSARKAAQDTEYWLRLVSAAGLVPEDMAKPLLDDAQVLESTITTLCVKARQVLETEATK